MLALKQAIDCSKFFRRVGETPSRALLLDYDGTIAPFTADRSRALPYPTVVELLDQIMTCGQTRLAMITGRPAKELKLLMNGGPCPEIFGTHGLERLKPDGSYELAGGTDGQRMELAEAEAWLHTQGLAELAEVKPWAIAVHWRGLDPDVVNEVRTAAYRVWSPIAHRAGFFLAEFDGGIELRLGTRNKGDAVRTILQELGEPSIAVYLGDDDTDEDAFGALREHDLGVLVREEYRETAADCWIRSPDELLQFLIDWAKACGGELC